MHGLACICRKIDRHRPVNGDGVTTLTAPPDGRLEFALKRAMLGRGLRL